jgi:carbon storage regulator
MLVLTRKMQQEIQIAGNIRLTVLEIRGDRVKLGLSAPREIEILRGELPVQSGKSALKIASR